MEIEDLQSKLDELKQMIREAETLEDLNDLHHKVGGSPEEDAAAAARRLAQIDAIDANDRCAWSKQVHELTSEQDRARAEWYAIMSRQTAYENKYC